MKYTLALLACVISLMQNAKSQIPYTITGVVMDENDQPLPGATIFLSPGKNKEVTDLNGRYSFSGLPPGKSVLFTSFIGYEKHYDTLFLNSNTIVDIRMQPLFQNLEEVVITGNYSELRRREESLNMEIVNDKYLKQNLGGSLMKSLKRLPGVDAMSIGSGQSKPMIRGLGFNRVAVLENGIKHEGQQWGSDHGLEIDQYGIDRVEVIKGPSSLMYGSDAIAGVILFNQSSVPKKNTFGGSADISGNTNNMLLAGSLRLFMRKEKFYISIRGTYQDYGDFRVPVDSVDIYSYRAPLYNNFLRNTAGREEALHIEGGWIRNGFTSRIFFSRLASKAGFFANAHGLEPRGVDTNLHDRSSRDIQFPYQQVSHWKLINRTAWIRQHHSLDLELGLQRNFRQEWSQYVNHGYMPAIFPDSLLFPADLERLFDKYIISANMRSTYALTEQLKIISGLQSEYQDNRIDGRGFIIPAFDQSRMGAFLVLKQDLGANSMLSGGLRYDIGSIHTREYLDWFTSPLIAGANSEDVFLQRAEELSRTFSNLTWTLGYTLDTERFHMKVNAGKSFRMPLAKELAANGVNYHHFSYERGNPDLSPEISYQLDLGVEWHSKLFGIGVSPFLGYFPNYIYLNPGFEHDRLYGNGNQVFTYSQSEVFRYGGELHAHYQLFRSLRMGIIGEYIYSVQMSGDKEGFGLPFSPPASLLLNLRYSKDRVWIFQDPYTSLDVRLVAAQRRIVPPEETTPGYRLINLGIGGDVMVNGHSISIGMQVQNLLNSVYFNHTSYYRMINVPEPGRIFLLNVSIPFTGPIKNSSSTIF